MQIANILRGVDFYSIYFCYTMDFLLQNSSETNWQIAMSGQAREDKLAHMVQIFAVFTFVTQPIETTRLCILRHALHVQRIPDLGTILLLEISSNKMSGEVLIPYKKVSWWYGQQNNTTCEAFGHT